VLLPTELSSLPLLFGISGRERLSGSTRGGQTVLLFLLFRFSGIGWKGLRHGHDSIKGGTKLRSFPSTLSKGIRKVFPGEFLLPYPAPGLATRPSLGGRQPPVYMSAMTASRLISDRTRPMRTMVLPVRSL